MKVKELSTPLSTTMRLADDYADKLVFNHSQKWKTGEKQNPHGVNKLRELLKSYLKKNLKDGWVLISDRLPTKSEQPCLIAMVGDKHLLSSELHGLHVTADGYVWYSSGKNEVSDFGKDTPPTHWITAPCPPSR